MAGMHGDLCIQFKHHTHGHTLKCVSMCAKMRVCVCMLMWVYEHV